jgi:hypothetical protein
MDNESKERETENELNSIALIKAWPAMPEQDANAKPLAFGEAATALVSK